MLIQLKNYQFDLRKPLDISISLHDGEQVNCYFAPPFSTKAVEMGNFIGDTNRGGLLNYKNVSLSPHGNGTHTECVGHISNSGHTINKALQQFHFIAQLVTITPENAPNGDLVISRHQIQQILAVDVEALIIRTLPNTVDKKIRNYNQTNPPYLTVEATKLIVEQGIQHLLVDLPSLDKEEDEGRLAAHKVFWQFPDNIRMGATITELIFVDDSISDGIYLLNLQIASFDMDAAPSKPILFAPLKP